VSTGLPRDAARLAAARAGLAAARDARAAPPGPDVETLRTAYLDVLKLCLCDLGGTSTVSVGAMPDGTVSSRELAGYELQLRAAGMDWPLQGLTMTGLARLDDLQACVESVVEDGVEGDLIEAGAWRGGASILMRATLDSAGQTDRTVWVADSFRGFPAGDGGGVDWSAFDFLAVPVDEVRDNFARFGCEHGVRFIPGFFEETLPGLSPERWAVVRLDGDTYDATKVALRSLYSGLSVGGYLIVDDYGAFDECRRAVDEFRRENAIAEPLEAVDWTCVRWRRGADASPASETETEAETATAEQAAFTGDPDGSRPRVPTARELELGRELAEARELLAAAHVRRGALRRLTLGALLDRMGDRIRWRAR